jgi:hypothetical protein
MGSAGTRSLFAATLCAGVAMLGISVHGLLGVDNELQRSAFAAQQHERVIHVINYTRGDCPQHAPPGAPSQRT